MKSFFSLFFLLALVHLPAQNYFRTSLDASYTDNLHADYTGLRGFIFDYSVSARKYPEAVFFQNSFLDSCLAIHKGILETGQDTLTFTAGHRRFFSVLQTILSPGIYAGYEYFPQLSDFNRVSCSLPVDLRFDLPGGFFRLKAGFLYNIMPYSAYDKFILILGSALKADIRKWMNIELKADFKRNFFTEMTVVSEKIRNSGEYAQNSVFNSLAAFSIFLPVFQIRSGWHFQNISGGIPAVVDYETDSEILSWYYEDFFRSWSHIFENDIIWQAVKSAELLITARFSYTRFPGRNAFISPGRSLPEDRIDLALHFSPGLKVHINKIFSYPALSI